MNSTAAKNTVAPVASRPPLKETLWKGFGIVFYISIAVGAVYHLLIPLLDR